MSCTRLARRTLTQWAPAPARSTRTRTRGHTCSRPYSTSPEGTPKSRHAQFYSDLVPGMLPIALLGSAVYLGLRLVQAHLSHEKFMQEARARVKELEEEVLALRSETSSKIAGSQASASPAERSTSRWWFW